MFVLGLTPYETGFAEVWIHGSLEWVREFSTEEVVITRSP